MYRIYYVSILGITMYSAHTIYCLSMYSEHLRTKQSKQCVKIIQNVQVPNAFTLPLELDELTFPMLQVFPCIGHKTPSFDVAAVWRRTALEQSVIEKSRKHTNIIWTINCFGGCLHRKYLDICSDWNVKLPNTRCFMLTWWLFCWGWLCNTESCSWLLTSSYHSSWVVGCFR